MFRIGVSQLPILKAPGLSANQARQVGEYAIELERERLARGLDIKDQPAKDLTAAYQKQKQRAGQPPIRNLVLTGRMLASRSVIQAADNSVQIGFSDSAMYQRAQVNESIDPELGISPSGKRKLDRYVTTLIFGELKLAA